MTLPFLNVSKQKIMIPVINKEYTIRPYLVGEEKAIYIASESKDEKKVIEAIKNLIVSCVDEIDDVDNISNLELEYLFLKLREISVNDVSDILVHHKEHKECNHAQKYSINLANVKVKGSKDTKILLDEKEQIGIIMKIPTLKMTQNINSKSQVDFVFNLIVDSIESIFDSKSIYNASEYTRDELIKWVNSLNQSQFNKIQSYYENLPKLYYDIEYTCEVCNKTEKYQLEGMGNFL